MGLRPAVQVINPEGAVGEVWCTWAMDGRLVKEAFSPIALEKVSVNLPGINTDYSYTASRHYPQTTFQLYQYSTSKNDAVQLRDDVPSNPIPAG